VEDAIYGDLFQWGRIADGHQSRTSDTVSYSSSTSIIGSGKRCSTNAQGDPAGESRPMNQIKPDSTKWFGKFIKTAVSPYNWTPSAQDNLWRTGNVYEDPCYRYIPSTGGYQDSWHTGADGTSTGIDACTNPGAGWRLPTQSEWGEIYKGGIFSGNPTVATANTWRWLSANATKDTPAKNKYKLAGGYRIQPDDKTTTLFLPASGYRLRSDGLLYAQGTYGGYWSSSVTSTNAYYLRFDTGSVNPASNNNRAFGFALRCIKNT
jgi:uncharacterized protein (TIGR02145 family)